ncbi:nitric oxide reductase FlRd-NAD(+) reductase [Halalkalicoccus paucihalophilus]|uniref:Nitric oxide reductase FlRd-NAD(+) reductase n=1 Tax=Halalkalicoccus paucihalophilus TaxID=1008153 RepID=A0A151ADT5_9EURY|nr:FAD-dependent oxidoreductase [Halalkalicoccus paucihalophilus]KYH25712.1 nitric oxide reductase FlRd-NAD(+) reductase [Halalkalicoccus paucihalophilus]
MRIVVCGAGYAGVTLAKRLEKALSTIEIVLVDRDPYHLIQHELHRVIRRPDLADVITLPLESLFDRVEVLRAEIEAVDRDERVIRCADREIAYDYAAVCLGAETNYYDLPGVEDHAIPLKRLEHAEAIRERVADDSRVVVGGAGLSGVQVAGELAALDSAPSITILEQFDSVAPNFPANFRAAVTEELETRGIDVRTGTPVECATAEAVETVDGESIEYDTFVWTGGIRGSASLNEERPAVRSDLRLDSRTFVVGDAARVVDDDGEAVPASAQAAIREARVVARSLVAMVKDDRDGFAPRPERFSFDSPGWLVSVGDGAVAQVGPTVLRGKAALALKASVGAGYLSSIGAVRNAVDLVNEELGVD